jgi:microcystin-dependent protein
MEAYLGQIMSVGFKLVPAGWLPCDGKLYPISEFTGLYNLIGTTYGGDGVSTFAVPDLRGRLVVGQGQGPGLSSYTLGQTGGVESVTLTPGQVGAHRHALMTAVRPTVTPQPPPHDPGPMTYLSTNLQPLINVYSKAVPDVSLTPNSIRDSYSAVDPHENRQPYVAINYIICSSGVYPSQP